MSQLWTRRPGPDEHPEFYAPYVAQVVVRDGAEVLKEQLRESIELFATLDEERAAYRYAPGKWSIKQVLGHLADGERILAMRALCFARGERAVLPAYDEDAYVAAGAFDTRPVASLLEEFRVVREASITLFAGMGEEQLDRRGRATPGEFTVRAVGWIIAGHESHHRQVLRERYLT